jgi:catechol 2,3-dioxygenase-like lactoylglutathione lyase family enzyme
MLAGRRFRAERGGRSRPIAMARGGARLGGSIMIDHIGVAVADMGRAKAFYVSALEPIGIGVLMEVSAEETGGEAHTGFGADDKAFFWIGTGLKPKGGTHVAFAVGTRAEVDTFHRAALAAGGRDNGAPGLRPEYHPDYYGAFVLDPDGNNIEAVCHQPG